MTKKLLILFLILFSSPVEAAVFYVSSSSGNDANSGTLSSPLRHIAEAIDRVNAGDTVYIRGGTYSETLTIPYDLDGTSSNPITFTNYSEENVYVKGATGGNTYTWTVNGDYIVIDGLNLKMYNCQLVGNGASLLIQGNHNTITNCNFVGTNPVGERYDCGSWEMGIIINGSDYNTISYCYFNGMPGNGVKMKQASSSNAPTYNRVHHCEYRNGISNGVSIEGQTYLWQYNLIDHNKFGESYSSDGCQTNGIFENNVPPSNYGLWYRYNELFGNAENGLDRKGARYYTIEYNTVWGNKGDNDGPTDSNGNDLNAGPGLSRGAGAGNAEDNLIRGNIVYDNHGGITIHKRDFVYNNTVLNNDHSYVGANQTTTGTSIYNGMDPYYDATATIVNNIIGYNYLCDMRAHVDGINLSRLDYNLYPSPMNNCRYDNPTLTKYTSMSAWRSYLNTTSNDGKDAHSLSGSLGLVDAPATVNGDPSNHDFSLTSTSIARGSAGPVTFANGSGSNSTSLVVDDPEGFSAGITYFGIPGDKIMIGPSSGPFVEAQISSISYSANRLNLTSPVSWSDNQGVYWCPEYTCPDTGRPDIGAVQYGASVEPPDDPVILSVTPNNTQVSGTSVTFTITTDKNAEVRFFAVLPLTGTTDMAYSLMLPVSTTGGTTHTLTTSLSSFCDSSLLFYFKAYEGGPVYETKIDTLLCTEDVISKAATFDSDSGLDASTPASNAHDRNTATSFGALNNSLSLIYDFGTQHHISKFSIYGDDSAGSSECGTVALSVSNDLYSWTPIITSASKSCSFNGWVNYAINSSISNGRYATVALTSPTAAAAYEVTITGTNLEAPLSEPKRLRLTTAVPKFNGKQWIFE